MRDNGYEILKAAQALDAEKRTIFVARCVRLLIEKGEYDSPLFCHYAPVKIELLIKEMCTPTTGFENVELIVKKVDLNSVERCQNQEVLSAESIANDLRNHDDGPLAGINVSRAEWGAIIVRWVIKTREQQWLTPEVPKEIGDLLFDRMHYWIPKFRPLL